MRAVAGAIIVLASAVMLGAGAIASAVFGAANKFMDAIGGGVMFGGVIVGLIGFGILFVALATPATENK